jgi:hypothetical protein
MANPMMRFAVGHFGATKTPTGLDRWVQNSLQGSIMMPTLPMAQSSVEIARYDVPALQRAFVFTWIIARFGDSCNLRWRGYMLLSHL